MIVTHHPLLFSGIKKLTDEDPAGRLIRQLVQHDIAVYSCHTPFDKTKGGNNDVLAGVLKLSNVRNLAGEKVRSPEDMVMRKEEADIGRCGEFRRPISVEELVERLAKVLVFVRNRYVSRQEIAKEQMDRNCVFTKRDYAPVQGQIFSRWRKSLDAMSL